MKLALFEYELNTRTAETHDYNDFVIKLFKIQLGAY